MIWAPPAPQPLPTPSPLLKGGSWSGGEGKEVLCDLQREAVSGPNAPPHPLHVAEEHNDAEEGEVAGDADEGAGHREVVQQVPGARGRWQLADSTSLLTSQELVLGKCKPVALEDSLSHAGMGARSPEPSEVGMDAERGPVHLDALAVDLDDRSGGRHVLGMGRGRGVRPRSCGCHSSQPNPMPPPGISMADGGSPEAPQVGLWAPGESGP